MEFRDKKGYPPTAEESIAEDAQRKENSQSDHSSFGYDNDEEEESKGRQFNSEAEITRKKDNEHKTNSI